MPQLPSKFLSVALVTGCCLVSLADNLKPAEVVKKAFGSAQAGRYQQADTALSSEDLQQRMKSARRELWDRFVRNGDFQKLEILRETVRGEGAEVQFRAHYGKEFWAPTSWGPARKGSALEGTLKLQRESGSWKLLTPDPDAWTIWYPDSTDSGSK